MDLSTPVPRRSELSVEQFQVQYAEPGLPVVIEGAGRHWPAYEKWTIDFFREHCALAEVRTTSARSALEVARHTTLGEYLTRLPTLTGPRPPYMTAWKFRPEFPELCRDFSPPVWCAENWLDELATPVDLMWIFIGPGGAHFRLHVDVGDTSAWNVQLSGRKRWRLFAPEVADRLYEGRVDAFEPDYRRYPRFADCPYQEAVVGDGDLIFVPGGWWHQTHHESGGVALTANFVDRFNYRRVLAALRARPDGTLGEQLEQLARRKGLPVA